MLVLQETLGWAAKPRNESLEGHKKLSLVSSHARMGGFLPVNKEPRRFPEACGALLIQSTEIPLTWTLIPMGVAVGAPTALAGDCWGVPQVPSS